MVASAARQGPVPSGSSHPGGRPASETTIGAAMRLGVLYTTDVYNSIYRALIPAEALRRKGHDVRVVKHDDLTRVPMEHFSDREVVHVFRRHDKVAAKFVDQLRARNIGVVYDNDDDLRLAPEESEFYKKHRPTGIQRHFREQLAVMRRAHLITTTTDTLAERWAQEVDRPIEVVPNYLGDQHFVRTARNAEGIVVGWVAGKEHVADARRLKVSEVLQDVMAKRPEVRVVTMGVRLDLDPARYTHHAHVPLYRLGEHVRKFDVGIAPLSDIPMSYARSDIKVKEYSAAGVPWLASDRGPYAGLQPKCGGLLVKDDAWEAALLELVSSKWKRLQLRRCAERWARSQRIEKHVGRWEAVWQEAAAMAREAQAA
jgi:glycosyltransferase involved in cell wall biosynthesis